MRVHEGANARVKEGEGACAYVYRHAPTLNLTNSLTKKNDRMHLLKASEISHMPAATITSRDFHCTNICWVRTIKGIEVDLLFDEYGFPLTDRVLISKIEQFFGKRFERMMIDEEVIYGQVMHQTRPAEFSTQGSSPIRNRRGS